MSSTEPHPSNRGIQPGVIGVPIATPGSIVHPARKDNDNLAGFRSHRPRDVLDATVVVFRLPAPSNHVDIALHVRAGTTRVVITDDQGAEYDTGDLHNTALGTDDTYRLKLRAIKVKGVPVPGLFDDIRISRRTDTGFADTTHFVYDQGGRLIGEYDATGSPIAEYVYLAGQPLAMLRGGVIYYYHTDHLGTPPPCVRIVVASVLLGSRTTGCGK